MPLRFSHLPPGLRSSIFSRIRPSRDVFQWTRAASFSSQGTTAASHRTSFLRWRHLWVLPVAGGLILYALPHPTTRPNILASPTIIPCTPKAQILQDATIMSPTEQDRTLWRRVLAILREQILEPVLTAGRFVYLCCIFLPVLVSAPMLLVGPPEAKLAGDRWGAVWWYGYLTAQMQRAGPTFIKLAQWAASRADLFPSLLCERMGALHSRGKVHPMSHTRKVIETIFQRPFEEVFEEFDETPIGSGAIAQVYKATLKPDLIPPSHLTPKHTGTHRKAILPNLADEPAPVVPTATVAIKVLHPRVRKTIDRDLNIMSFFARVINILPGMEWLSLPEEVAVFGQMMHEQLDLRIEADNLLTFEKNFNRKKLPVAFPRPLREWSTNDLLLEEFQNALPLESFMKMGGGPFNDVLAEVGLDAFLNMLLLDNFVHSDLHPGNIMIKFTKQQPLWTSPWASFWSSSEGAMASKDSSDAIVDHLRTLARSPAEWQAELHTLGAQGWTPEIVFVDAGLVTTLNEVNRRNFIDLFRAIAEFDGYRAGVLMVERCRTPQLAVDVETFALRMQHIVLGVKRKTFSLGQIKISNILTDVLKAVRRHHVKMEGDFVNTVISVLLLEGIGRQLDPTLDLFKSALPILRQLGRQMSTQENMAQMPSGEIGTFFKVWVLLEARTLASGAFSSIDDLVRYDWLTPGI